MQGRIRLLLVAAAIAAGAFGTTGATAVTPCPDAACTDVTGTVFDPHGNPAPSYQVVAKRADGYNETTTTDAAGHYEFHLPVPGPNNCYQIVGTPDPYYTKSSWSQKACVDAHVDLHPSYRINGVTGLQKVYLGDTSADVSIPTSVSALSRTFPAPFDGDRLTYAFDYLSPAGGEEEEIAEGSFAAPEVRQIADGVWQYLWTETVTLPSHKVGYYDMDWGEDTVFSPMMDCRMIWFGYGTSAISPSEALPTTTVTLTGQNLGSTPGSVVLKGSGSITTITGPNIVSWSDTQVKFIIPLGAKSGWAAAVPPSGVKTNAQYIKVDP